jgi:uncharacterized membrane protein YbhN (UPF0104 family)
VSPPATVLEATLVCIALVIVDLVVRAWRIQWIIQGLGHRIGFRDSFVLNAYGDAAFVAISLEVLAAWPVILAAAGWLAWRYAPAWWETTGPRLAEAAVGAWPWVLLVALASALAWRFARKVASPAVRHVRRPVRRALVYWRRMPLWPLVASVPLSFLNLATRVAILPVLALTLPAPPDIGPMLLGSFGLLYSQLILPTPSGAGAVELGFLGGAAGDLGARAGWLLLAWRFYTNGVGVLLGVGLAAHAYGWPALRRLARRWSDPD